MSSSQPAPADRQLPRGHLLVLNRSFRRTLEAENKSPRTIEAYTDAVRLLATYCQAHGHQALASVLERQHVQAFIADQLTRWKPATAHNRYRGLHAFFKWAVAEGDLQASPMDGMKPPQLPEQPVEVVRPEHLARLLKTCERRDFASRRDTASASSGCWARVDGLGRCRSAAGPPRHWTATCGPESATGWPTWRSSGSAATDP